MPLFGSDNLPLKLLRCGHTLDQTCWKHWVDSSVSNGNGNHLECPICRQEIGKKTTDYDSHSGSFLLGDGGSRRVSDRAAVPVQPHAGGRDERVGSLERGGV